MKIIGKLNQILDTQSGETERGTWYRSGMVLESLDGQQRLMAFTVQGKNNVEQLQQLAVGSTLQVEYVIESRQFNEKWYTDLRTFNIDVLKAG